MSAIQDADFADNEARRSQYPDAAAIWYVACQIALLRHAIEVTPERIISANVKKDQKP